jgi:hypothetical protein
VRNFNLNWRGWYYMNQLPSQTGIYCVWAAVVRRRREDNELVVNPREARLVYIGESDDVHTRVNTHEKEPCWRRQLASADESIIFTYVPMDGEHESWRKAVENCLIAHHTPPCNTDDTTFHYDLGTNIINSGMTFGKLISPCICVGLNDPDNRR